MFEIDLTLKWANQIKFLALIFPFQLELFNESEKSCKSILKQLQFIGYAFFVDI